MTGPGPHARVGTAGTAPSSAFKPGERSAAGAGGVPGLPAPGAGPGVGVRPGKGTFSPLHPGPQPTVWAGRGSGEGCLNEGRCCRRGSRGRLSVSGTSLILALESHVVARASLVPGRRGELVTWGWVVQKLPPVWPGGRGGGSRLGRDPALSHLLPRPQERSTCTLRL